MAISDWVKRQKLRRLERRGDIVARWSEEAQALVDLGGDLIPGPEREVPRDLYGLLVYAWAARADRGEVFHADEVLRRVRARAWHGYTDMPALLREIRAALPRGGTGPRMVAFFEELAAKRSTYLFLPVVSRIDRHQGEEGPLPVSALKVDGLADRHADRRYGRLVRDLFAAAPAATRDRDTVLVALMVLAWDKGKWEGDITRLLAALAGQLRVLYDAPNKALTAVQADTGDPDLGAVATEMVHAAEEISARAPWLWLEALFIVENWITGPQFYEHAFEVKVIPTADRL